MLHIQRHAEQAVRDMLRTVRKCLYIKLPIPMMSSVKVAIASKERTGSSQLVCADYMDDGTPINLTVYCLFSCSPVTMTRKMLSRCFVRISSHFTSHPPFPAGLARC